MLFCVLFCEEKKERLTKIKKAGGHEPDERSKQTVDLPCLKLFVSERGGRRRRRRGGEGGGETPHRTDLGGSLSGSGL